MEAGWGRGKRGRHGNNVHGDENNKKRATHTGKKPRRRFSKKKNKPSNPVKRVPAHTQKVKKRPAGAPQPQRIGTGGAQRFPIAQFLIGRKLAKPGTEERSRQFVESNQEYNRMKAARGPDYTEAKRIGAFGTAAR